MGWVVTPQYIRSWSILAPWTFGIFFLSSWLWATWSADVQVKFFVPSFATEDGVKEHPQPVSIWISKIHQFGMIRLVRCSILWFLLAVYVNQSFVLTSDFAKVPAGLSQSLLESAFTGVCPALDVTAITASLIITAIHIYIRFAEFRCFPTATLDMKTKSYPTESLHDLLRFFWDGALSFGFSWPLTVDILSKTAFPSGNRKRIHGCWRSCGVFTSVAFSWLRWLVKLCEHNRGWVETWRDDDVHLDYWWPPVKWRWHHPPEPCFF